MSPRPPDQPLRRAVAELAGLGDDDIRAILAALTKTERAKVEALLETYAAAPVSETAAVPAEPPPEINLAGLSPWLAQRLQPAPPSKTRKPAPWPTRIGFRRKRRADGPAAVITPVALEALRACAASAQGYCAPKRKTTSGRRRRSLLGGRPLQGAQA